MITRTYRAFLPVLCRDPDEASITWLVRAILLEQNDEWQLQHRYMTLETMAGRTDEQPTALNQ